MAHKAIKDLTWGDIKAGSTIFLGGKARVVDHTNGDGGREYVSFTDGSIATFWPDYRSREEDWHNYPVRYDRAAGVQEA